MRAVVAFRELLPSGVRDSLDQLVARINTVFLKEHAGDGAHTDITADSVTADALVSTGSITAGTAITAVETIRAQSVVLTDGITAPSAVSGFAQVYVDTADGDLKVVFGDGTVKTIVTDT
jgi:hypothetical protein